MELKQIKEEIGKLARKAAIYFVIAGIMMVAALAINDLPIRLIAGSAGAIFVGLALLKINELDRLPCKHCI